MDTPDTQADDTPSAGDDGGEGQAVGTRVVAASRRRESIRSLSRVLADADLNNPGAQRLILEDWDRAEAKCEELEVYVDRYHEADKLAAVLQAKLDGLTRVDIMYGAGLAIGGALLGMIPSLGWPAAIAGGVLVVGSIVARAIR